MNINVHYSICRYVPSMLRGEKVNIGFAYHIPNLKKMGFVATKNKRRIRSFDDELEIDMIDAIFESLTYDFTVNEPDMFGLFDEVDLSNPYLLNNKISNYINQIQFEDVSIFKSEDAVETILNDISDLYLYYDKPKSQRINHQRVQSLAKKIVRSSVYKDTLRISRDEKKFRKSPYDFELEFKGRRKYIKTLSFDYVKTNILYKEIKCFLYDLQEEINNGTLHLDDIELVINNTELEKQYEKSIIEQLPTELRVYTLEQFSETLR